MSLPKEAEEDFKLPLRPWLEKQINSGQYKGLEWEYDETGKQTRYFHLPWVKKNLPDWEEYYRIFRAWADHRGRGGAVNSDDSKLKSNFRCALNKSVDFEEEQAKSTLHLQTGNYKVYRILAPQEVREKKSKKVLTKEEQQNASRVASLQINFDSGDFKTIDKGDMDFLENMDIDEIEIATSGSPVVAPPMQEVQGLTPLLDGNPNLCSTGYFVEPNDMAYTHINVVPPMANDDYNSGLAISPTQYASDPAALQEHQTPMEMMTGSEVTPGKNQANNDVFLTQYYLCGIKPEDFNKCDLIVKYEGKEVLKETLDNFSEGFRMFFGDQDKQVKVLKMRKATDEKLSDFKHHPVKLPSPDRDGIIKKILEKTELGFIIQYDPCTLEITAKRLCQSQIFFFDPASLNQKIDPIKLEREDVKTLLSYKTYLLNMIQFYSEPAMHSSHDKIPFDTDITLSVGIKPKSKREMAHISGVQIKLLPHALKGLLPNKDCNPVSLSLCFSNPNSMEELLRQIQQ